MKPSALPIILITLIGAAFTLTMLSGCYLSSVTASRISNSGFNITVDNNELDSVSNMNRAFHEKARSICHGPYRVVSKNLVQERSNFVGNVVAEGGEVLTSESKILTGDIQCQR